MARGNSRAQSELPSGIEATRADVVRYQRGVDKEADRVKRKERAEAFERRSREAVVKNRELAVEAGLKSEYQKVDLNQELKGDIDKSRFAPGWYSDVSVRINDDGLFEAKGKGWSMRFGNGVLEEGVPVREAIMKNINQFILQQIGADEYYAERPNENPGG